MRREAVQPTHLDLATQIARITAILEPLPNRLDSIEEKLDRDIRELRDEIYSLKEQRSHLVGIGVGIGATVTFIAGLLTTFGERLFTLFSGNGSA